MMSLIFLGALLLCGQAGSYEAKAVRSQAGASSFPDERFCSGFGDARGCWSKTLWSGLSWVHIAHPNAVTCRKLIDRAVTEALRPGGYAEAVRLLKRAIRLEPGWASPRRALLHLYLSHHKWRQAAGLFRKITSPASKADGANVLLRAVVLTRAGRPDTAIHVLRRIMDDFQQAGGGAWKTAVLLNDAAEVLLAAGMPHMAVDLANAALKRRRRYLAAWYTRSAALLLDGRVDVGFASLKGAMVQDSAGAFLFRPGLIFLGVLGRRFYLAAFLQRAGCTQEADAMWRQYARRFKANPYGMAIGRIRRWKLERSIHSKGGRRCLRLGAQFRKGLKRALVARAR